MTSIHQRIILAAAVATSLALGACGGDDDAGPPAPAVTEAVPDSASQSTAGFIDYLKQLVVASADLLEPVDVSAVMPPVDDTSEPDSTI